jgi:hypothetical protein
MGMRQMTFEIPDEVAEDFVRDVPATDERSRILTTLLRRRYAPKFTSEQWDAICKAANSDPETQEIEREMAALPDTMTEEWNEPIELPKAG